MPITVYKNQEGATRCVEAVDPAWLTPGSGVWVWVDISNPTPEESKILSNVFKFHELAIEDALAEIHHPKVESYGDYLYVILHGSIASRLRTSISSLASSSWSPFTPVIRERSARCATCARATIAHSARGPGPCCTASSTQWSITIVLRSTS
jgi:hypothetical protein